MEPATKAVGESSAPQSRTPNRKAPAANRTAVFIRRGVLYLLAAFFIFAGAKHFQDPDFYVKIIPPALPWRLAAVYISGVAEIAGGFGLLIPALRRSAAWGLIALLIVVFPANVYMAVADVQVTSYRIAPALLWLRLPLQALLAWLVLWSSQSPRG